MKPETLNELALFAGAGGGILGGKLRGWRTVCAVEWDAYARDVLVARQNDGCLEAFPIWDDVQTFDGRPWRGRVDVVSGGFPCQDISAAGKGAGIEGERSGMWVEMARIIGEVRPRFAFVENSPMLTSRGLGTCLGDLAAMGYHARWGVVGAIHAGAPHKRDRIWILAESRSAGTGYLNRSAGDADGRASGQHVPALRQAHGADGSNRADPAGASLHVANPRRAGLQGCQQPGTLRDERDGEETHGSASECGSSPGSPLRHATSEGLPHGIERPMGQPGAEPESERSDWWATEPDVGGKTDGMATKLDEGKAHD